MGFKQIDASEFDAFVSACLSLEGRRPQVDIFQSSAWGSISRPMGLGEPLFLAQTDETGEIITAGMYYQNSAKYLGGYLYCQHGPVLRLGSASYASQSPLSAHNWGEQGEFNSVDRQKITAFLTEVEAYAGSKGLFMVVYEPLSTIDSPLTQTIAKAGYSRYKRSVLPKYPMFIDLLPTEEEMIAGIGKSTRYNIRQAQKLGVQVRVIYPDMPQAAEEFTAKYSQTPASAFYELLKTVSGRKMYSIPPLSFFENAWSSFQGTKSIAFVFAEYEGKILSANFSQFFGDWAGSYYTANLPGFSKEKASYLLKWQTIMAAKQQGKLVFDMWGYYPGLKPSHPEFGYGEFKKGFRGIEKVFAGWQVKAVSPLKYAIWRVASELKALI
jgi:lipid II:glycine glycyltransferase (peptidoglycan interpeptide bridge formation enzyme)